ncbi:MAG: sulfatase-like hydrolase/transferase [Pseudomonadota bacterium]
MSRNLVYIIMDSCRFDSYQRAKTPNMDRIAEAEQRFSYASWTAPSHHSIFMGQVAHKSPSHILASEVYREEYKRWIDRLDIPDLSFSTFVPELSLSKVLQDEGYWTTAKVSMPVLNPMSGLNRYFDDYALMASHFDFAGMLEDVHFSKSQPSYFFFNVGETHYPYMLKDESLPRISGVHGVVKHMDGMMSHNGDLPEEEPAFFTQDQMRALHDQQVRCVEYVDGLLGTLFEKCPPDTHFIITADHGECFGEENYFGHGPILHRKVFEIPFLEGRLQG